MNEMLDSQLSAMFDDELPAAECELLARRLSRDEALQARWRHYAIIGAAVRGERGLALGIDLRRRVRKAVAAEAELSPVPSVAGADAGRVASSRRALAGRGGRGRRRGRGGLVGVLAALAGSRGRMRPSWRADRRSRVGGHQRGSRRSPTATSCRPPSNRNSVVPTAELANYVVAHSEYSAPLSRRNLLSSLVATRREPLRANGRIRGSTRRA